MTRAAEHLWLDMPEPELRALLGGVVGAMSTTDDGPTPLQWELLEAVTRHVFLASVMPRDVPRLGPEALATALTEPDLRALTVHLIVTLELVVHPTPPALAHPVARYARSLAVAEPMVEAARRFADHHLDLLYLDIQRSSEFTERALFGFRHGRLLRLLRNKLAHENVVPDAQIAQRLRALDDCQDGSWGRAVAAFYREPRPTRVHLGRDDARALPERCDPPRRREAHQDRSHRHRDDHAGGTTRRDSQHHQLQRVKKRSFCARCSRSRNTLPATANPSSEPA